MKLKLPNKFSNKQYVMGIAIALLVLAVLTGVWRFYGGRYASGTVAADEGPFVALECSSRLFEERTALAVMFSQPLSRKEKLGEQLSVLDIGVAEPQRSDDKENPSRSEPLESTLSLPAEAQKVKGEWVLGDNPRIAYFPFIKPQRRYVIQVGSQIAAIDGRHLATASHCELTSMAMPENFFFASRGLVLPAHQNGGLPVVTVNVPEVDVEFLRVDQALLPRFFAFVAGRPARHVNVSDDDEGADEYSENYWSRSSLNGHANGWQLDALKDLASSVYTNRFLTDNQSNRRHVTHLPVENIKALQEPGIYVAVMRRPGRFGGDYQVTHFYVTDMGLHARRYAQRLEVFVTSLKSGKSLSGMELELLNEEGKSIAKAKADGDGQAVFENYPTAAKVLVARRGQEMSVLNLQEPALDLSEFDIGGHLPRNAKLFAYSGRDLYRPGEKFELSVLARDAGGNAIAAVPLTVQLKRPDGKGAGSFLLRPQAKFVGYYQQTMNIPGDAATGKWRVELRVDPGSQQPDKVLTFSVEEFVPERMKLNLQASAKVLKQDESLTVSVKGEYLYGAPASGNRLLGSVQVSRNKQAVAEKLPGFLFGDVDDDKERKRSDLSESTLDETGQTRVEIPLEVQSANSPLLVRSTFSLLESGGRPVVRSSESTVWPAPALVGLRPLFAGDMVSERGRATFELVRVTPEGAFQPSGKLQLRLYREDRDYYWRYDDQRGWHSGFTENEELVESRTLSLKERSKIDVQVVYGRYRLEILDPEHDTVTKYRFYAGWNAQEAEALGNRPDRVQVRLDKAAYVPGDTARLSIVPPHDGEALVVVESDRSYWSKRVSVSARGTEVSIPVDKTWNRHDLYVSVVAFRPGSQGDRVTPARAVGLIPLPISADNRKIALTLDVPQRVTPETDLKIQVKAEGLAGKAGMVTLSAVDAGILNITRFKSPDPLDFFFGKHRYGADILDLYGRLIEKLDGSAGKLKFGGDSGMRDTKSLPKKVRLVDLFSGPVAFDAAGHATITLKVPDFNGTLRLMAVASGESSYGGAEKEVTVAAPIVAELLTPRFIALGDQATMAMDVTNMLTTPQAVKLNIESSGPVSLGDAHRTVQLKPQQRTTLRFPVRATDAIGMGVFNITVEAPGDRNTPPITIKREVALQVQPILPEERIVRYQIVKPGESLKLDATQLAVFHPQSATLALSISGQSPINVRRLVRDLVHYPYGCAEQTTSTAYPYVSLDEKTFEAAGVSKITAEERARRVDVALGRLAGYQNPQGGFSLWGGGVEEPWITAYVTGFLQDAKAAGFSVPDSMLSRAEEALLRSLNAAAGSFSTRAPANVAPTNQPQDAIAEQWVWLNNWNEGQRLDHQRFASLALSAYILARDNRAPLSTLRTLFDDFRTRTRSPLPLVHLGLALKLMGDEKRAQRAFDLAIGTQQGMPVAWGNWNMWLGDYGTPARDYAMAYALLERHKVAHPRKEGLLAIAGSFARERQWYSTQESLALVLAARAAESTPQPEWKALLLAGKLQQPVTSRGNEVRSFTTAQLVEGISLTNTGSAPLYIDVTTSGYRREPTPPKTDVFEIQRTLYEPNGNKVGNRALKVGESLVVHLEVRTHGVFPDALVVDRIPAGFEIENLNLSQGEKLSEFKIRVPQRQHWYGPTEVKLEEAINDPRIRYREYRDDRFVAAVKLDGVTHLFYLVRVVTPGSFVNPPALVEDMYRPEFRGTGAGGDKIEVVDSLSKQ